MLPSSIRNIGDINMANKVQFGLKNVHYAIQTVTTTGVSYGTPVAVAGAVSLTLDPNSSVKPFYADNMVYYNAVANNGYTGSLELAKVPDGMLSDIWGQAKDSDNVIVETNDVEPKVFALLYQIEGDVNEECYVLYNVTATKPAIGSQTVADSKEPQTRSCNIEAVASANGKIMARTTDTTTTTTKTSWFSSVYTG